MQSATNGVRFAQDLGLPRAKDAGMRMAYLQFDGVGNEENATARSRNLFDVKLQAIEHLHAAGIDVRLVVTVVNTINNDQVGQIIRFAVANSDKVNARVVPAGLVHRPGRGHDRRRATASATRCRTWPRT